MKIVVIGGTGRTGSKVINLLTADGHEAVAASPNTGVNTITGEGLAEALSGADVVVDVSNAPSFEDRAVMDFFTTSTANLIAAEKVAGVNHHVALSIVGVERPSDGGYFKAKAAQEQLIRDSGLPYSIVHATQFFEFIGGIADSATDGDTVTLPPVLFQPVAADDVAAAVARAAAGAPVNGTVAIAGPEVGRFDEIVGRVLQSRNDHRRVVADPAAPYFGAHVTERSLVPEEGSPVGEITLDAWLEASAK
ncbi:MULTISPECIES: SDR family oxidoreductase [Streptomyces]|uniref:NmrA family transcriptional regulator n=1 Tax=Streptomyces dengpaensis TaxID=2049881 RepID=A0ABM6T0V2_9ACTN|nr:MULTISPECIES: NAD(P)H-binding protein [Streptomyces]AVH60632.1 NmrA family transcriptional regulator [Streptomyces dengpaensis]PIB02761.1 NmrA family transcriptional regulator [Streptomyces sp. HG99]